MALREYETAFIVQPEISDEGCQTLCEKLDVVLERGGATRLMLEDWGRRKLAYEIKNFQKGRYFFLSYLDGGQVVPQIERALRLQDSILRFLTVRVADSVTDVEARKAEAAEKERIQREKAAERAAREAEAERASAEASERAAREAPARGEAAHDEGAGEEAEAGQPSAEVSEPAEHEAAAREETSDDEEAEESNELEAGEPTDQTGEKE